MRSSRNQVRRFPSFFTELGMLGVVGHGEGQWLQSRGQKGSQKIKSKQIGRIFCYFPNPTLDSCLKNKPSDQQFDSSLPGNIVFLRTQDSMLESIAFVANLDTEILLHTFISLLPGSVGWTCQEPISLGAGLQQSSLKDQSCGPRHMRSLLSELFSIFAYSPFPTIVLFFNFKTAI